MKSAPIKLRLPATSANLGPGFDALGLAMDFYLGVEAWAAETDSIHATGRNVDVIGRPEDSLVLSTFCDVLAGQGREAPRLALKLHNEIPLGMGCGSSAAALVAGVALASHFGELRWSQQQVLTEASRREGHPDNVAACVLGELTASAMQVTEGAAASVQAVSIPIRQPWPLLVVLPGASLSTKTARALLPGSYSKADAVANVQAVALLTAAFSTGRGDLLAAAMQDRMHQPYRAMACPMLPLLLPLCGHDGVLGVALSGAGPSILMVLDPACDTRALIYAIEKIATSAGQSVECLATAIAAGGLSNVAGLLQCYKDF